MVLCGGHLPCNSNRKKRNQLPIRIQNFYDHLDNFFVPRTRHTNSPNQSKIWVHKHLNKIVFQPSEGFHVSSCSFFLSSLANSIKFFDFGYFVSAEVFHLLLKGVKIAECLLDETPQFLHQHRPSVSDLMVFNSQHVRHHMKTVSILVLKLFGGFGVVSIDSKNIIIT